MTSVAIIPARGGSKGLPGKNIVDLSGKPLIVYTIVAAKKSKVFDRVVVTTDDEQIVEVSENAGAEVIRRPVQLAQDHSSSLDVIKHALNELELKGGVFCLLQPTSPLRNATHIVEANEIYQRGKTTSVISAAELEHHPFKSLVSDGKGGYEPVSNISDLVSPRQKLPTAIAPNGAIYFCDVESFLDTNEIFYPDTKFYQMSIADSVDIDTLTDLQQAAFYLDHKEMML